MIIDPALRPVFDQCRFGLTGKSGWGWLRGLEGEGVSEPFELFV
jgi:hypothetical protein